MITKTMGARVNEPWHQISNNVVCATNKASAQPAYFMRVKLLTEHHLEFLSIKGGCTGLSEFTLVKMSYCWKAHVAAQMWSATIVGGV